MLTAPNRCSLVPGNELLVGVGYHKNLIRRGEHEGSAESILIQGVAIEDREELLGEMPPAKGKKPCTASAGEDQGFHARDILYKNNGIPLIYIRCSPSGFYFTKKW